MYKVPGGHMVNGRFVRAYANSTKPPHFWSEIWQMMTPKAKAEAIATYEKEVQDGTYEHMAALPALANLGANRELCFGFMPTVQNRKSRHRNKNPTTVSPMSFYAAVARPVTKKEVKMMPAAEAALLKEWTKLRNATAWDESAVREWRDVAEEARRKGKKAHVGRIFEICVEKGSELPVGDPNRLFKGRVVFQGNGVHDENYDQAIFQDVGSSPAAMAASKACDLYGLLPGNDEEIADAEQAYVQALLKGDPTWVRLPRERWPAAWKNMHDPVCPLRVALYGHPDAGGYWEQHLEGHLATAGYAKIKGAAWRSVFYHDKLELMLVVYVDDFKLAGPKHNIAAGWAAIRKNVQMGEPTPLGKFLGCDHKVTTRRIPAGGNPSQDYSENDLKGQIVKEVKCIEYDMESFMSSCVDRYCELAKINRTALRHVETPFIDEPKADKEWRTRIIENCDRVAEGKPPLPMPASKPELVNPHGQLHEYAARVLMKILYGARLARKDLLRAIGALATFITKWDK